MLLIELIYHCEKNLETAKRTFCNAAYSIAAEQLAELSNLIQNELADAIDPTGDYALSTTSPVRKVADDSDKSPEASEQPTDDQTGRKTAEPAGADAGPADSESAGPSRKSPGTANEPTKPDEPAEVNSDTNEQS